MIWGFLREHKVTWRQKARCASYPQRESEDCTIEVKTALCPFASIWPNVKTTHWAYLVVKTSLLEGIRRVIGGESAAADRRGVSRAA